MNPTSPNRLLFILGCLALGTFPCLNGLAEEVFQLGPAVAIEAEDFHVEKGWKVIKNGEGNYMVDIVGFQHVSGERLLCSDEKDSTAAAYLDVEISEMGDYRFWVRYEYPTFCEMRFQVLVEQNGKTIAQQIMGGKDAQRFGYLAVECKGDLSWGSEGLTEEKMDVKGLAVGKARLWLKAVEQPQAAGVSAHRNIDLLYLTKDTQDLWRTHYAKTVPLYPILEAFRDTRGARYEARVLNRGDKEADFVFGFTYNRLPFHSFFYSKFPFAARVAPAAGSEWTPLKTQDTTHVNLFSLKSASGQPFELQVRPVGGTIEKTVASSGGLASVYLPPYPNKGDAPAAPLERIHAVLKHLEATPPVGRTPTLPLGYGMSFTLNEDSDTGRAFGKLYMALGLRSLPMHSLDFPTMLTNLTAAGFTHNKSAVALCRPLSETSLRTCFERYQKLNALPFIDSLQYGDEIDYHHGLYWMEEEKVAETKNPKIMAETVYPQLWQEWLKKNRPSFRPDQYWRKSWGPADAARLRPDSTAGAAAENPRLYVDSVAFFQDTGIAYFVDGNRRARALFGENLRTGLNYGCHPWYYPDVARFVTWFRRGAADFACHSEYFWQIGMPGPMVNGYLAEHFRCGLRTNPKGLIRQYVMPHSPGNTAASFLRTAFTHLAHGVKMQDFFCIAMNGDSAENYIDLRDVERYRCIRDVTHSMGLIEDLVLESSLAPSAVAMLISESTERWDYARIATDPASYDISSPGFRQMRLSYHQERMGLWYALTFLGAAPDLLIEADLTPDVLKGYQVLYATGDCLAKEAVPALQKWIEDGGVLMATAGAGRFDAYHDPNPALQQLLGIQSRAIQERDPFMRPRQELPFLKPLSFLKGNGWEMPQIATHERIQAEAHCETLASFKEDGRAAVISRQLGKGRVYFVAALPGLAYLWSALQPPHVPDRGPWTHTVPTRFDAGAKALIELPLKERRFEPLASAGGRLVDLRLIRAPKGYFVPLANYEPEVGQAVTVSLKISAPLKKVTSAYCGVLPFKVEGERVMVTLSRLGYGDVLRLDMN
ncbi:MAG: beta-galactosidase trimerization domain-containing protein [Verrucomicrobia bacterium]|nr:beta-galactosidase trimerization domain-containing protein [Verrucomicrobiota bacterium]